MAAGASINRYEVVRKIARGGMGEIYLARQIGFGGFAKDVVLKKIHDSFADDPQFVTMFLEEARIAAMLNHSNIVQIFGLGQRKKSYFIVMEYVQGLSLSRLLQRHQGPLPVHFAVKIAADIAAGLQYAHDMRDSNGEPLNLVHRDVSPPNILTSISGDVKITDFGIAKVKWSTAQTRAGVVKGKYSYLAPEQVQGNKASRQSDLYSIGLNLYEMTTANRAYPVGDPIHVLRSVASGSFRSPLEHVPDYPKDLLAVLNKALDPDPDQRYAECSYLYEDLMALLDRWGTPVTPSRLGRFIQQAMDVKWKPTPKPPHPLSAAPPHMERVDPPLPATPDADHEVVTSAAAPDDPFDNEETSVTGIGPHTITVSETQILEIANVGNHAEEETPLPPPAEILVPYTPPMEERSLEEELTNVLAAPLKEPPMVAYEAPTMMLPTSRVALPLPPLPTRPTRPTDVLVEPQSYFFLRVASLVLSLAITLTSWVAIVLRFLS